MKPTMQRPNGVQPDTPDAPCEAPLDNAMGGDELVTALSATGVSHRDALAQATATLGLAAVLPSWQSYFQGRITALKVDFPMDFPQAMVAAVDEVMAICPEAGAAWLDQAMGPASLREWLGYASVDERKKEYGKVVWTVEDVLDAVPSLTEAQAAAWLESNGRRIQDRMTTTGWEAIETLLAMDGHTRSDDEEEDGLDIGLD